MRKLLLLLFFTSTISFYAQEQHKDLNWFTNFDKAQKVAIKENKPMLLLFTGSDWCPPCMAMHRDLFSNKEFINLSHKFVLVYVDFPKRKQLSSEQRKLNYELAAKYHRGGVPTIVFLSPKGDVLKKVAGYMFGKPQRQLEAMKNILKTMK